MSVDAYAPPQRRVVEEDIPQAQGKGRNFRVERLACGHTYTPPFIRTLGGRAVQPRARTRRCAECARAALDRQGELFAPRRGGSR